MPIEPDEITVIRSVLQGQQSAYTVLVSRYQSYVFTLAMRYVDNREVAEELSQDVFVKAYKCLADFKGTSKFSTWLYTIVHTTCLSYLRKKKNEAISLDEEQMIAVSGEADNSPATTLERKTALKLLENAMRMMTPEDAQLLTLFYHAEQSIDEIGIIMGMSTGNVKVRLFRARNRLKEILKDKYSKEFYQ